MGSGTAFVMCKNRVFLATFKNPCHSYWTSAILFTKCWKLLEVVCLLEFVTVSSCSLLMAYFIPC